MHLRIFILALGAVLSMAISNAKADIVKLKCMLRTSKDFWLLDVDKDNSTVVLTDGNDAVTKYPNGVREGYVRFGEQEIQFGEKEIIDGEDTVVSFSLDRRRLVLRGGTPSFQHTLDCAIIATRPRI